MRRHLSARGSRAIVIAGIALTLTAPASGSTTPSPDPSQPAATSPASHAPSPSARLDVGIATVREAARASAEASDDGGTDAAPIDRSKDFKALLPACDRLAGVAKVALLTAACFTNHCNASGSALDQSPFPRPARPLPTPPAACVSKGLMLW